MNFSMMRRAVILLIFSFLPVVGLFAQLGGDFSVAPPDERWTITTRWDYRVRVDDRYLGFANRELRESFRRVEERPAGWGIEGEARMLGATKKDGVLVAAALEGTEDISFVLADDGTILEADDGYPRLRGFPTFPDEFPDIGDWWEAPLDILVTGPDGEQGVLHQVASYRYLGLNPYQGGYAYFFDVGWAVRYTGGYPEIDEFLQSVQGSHQVSLVVDAVTMAPIFARDELKEQWTWADSRVEQRDGFALIFWKGVPPLDRGRIRDEFEDQFPGDVVIDDRRDDDEEDDVEDDGSDGTEFGDEDDGERDDEERDDEDIVIRETDDGLSVTLRNLHFKPDLAELVPGDEPLLDKLASILDSVPGRTVLIRGHTADVGRPDEERSLSLERARTVADEMARRGIDPRRLIYEGVGASEPAASNETEEGRRLNRRVEFLILED